MLALFQLSTDLLPWKRKCLKHLSRVQPESLLTMILPFAIYLSVRPITMIGTAGRVRALPFPRGALSL